MASRSRLKPWMFVSAVWLAPTIFSIVSEIGQRRLAGEAPASWRDIIWSGGDWLVYAILTPPIFWVSRRWPIARPDIVRRALLHVLFALLFCVGWPPAASCSRPSSRSCSIRGSRRSFRAIHGTGTWRNAGIDWLSWC